jgi:hypothetical protein
MFFDEREKFARSLGFIKHLSFCAVIRAENHPLRPKDYRPLDSFWNALGFVQKTGLTTKYEWLDREQVSSSFKDMQFWIKDI